MPSLRDIIEHAAHLLPAQGPITAFVHHNTLHAFEGRPFSEAVKTGLRIFGCQPYFPEKRYRELLAEGRIRSEDLVAVLLDDLGDESDRLIGRFGTRFHLWLAMLQYPLPTASRSELRWLLAESEALRKFRAEAPVAVRKRMIDETRHLAIRHLAEETADVRHCSHVDRPRLAGLVARFGRRPIDSWSEATREAFCLNLLWQTCRDGVLRASSPPTPPEEFIRHRDLLLGASGEDSDLLVNDILIRLCAAFLDQGVADWPLPHREEGLYQAFLKVYCESGGPPDRWLSGLTKELKRLIASGMGSIESIEESLNDLGVEPEETERFISETLLALRGWAGMIWQLETRGDRVAHPAPPGSLVDFLAVRLILERRAVAHLAKEFLDFDGPLRELRRTVAAGRGERPTTSLEERAFHIFELAQVLEWRPQLLSGLRDEEWSQIVREIEGFPSLERRRIYQAAYERRFKVVLLDAVSIHAAQVKPRPETPAFQVVCCIDDREESYRRHLEEIAPHCETFGYVGFYGVAMYYRGAAEAHYLPLCPVIIKPDHYVREEVSYPQERVHRLRAETRKAVGAASHRWHVGSRSFLGGIFTALTGSLTSIPMVARILFPRATSQFRGMFGRFVAPPQGTRLKLERQNPLPGTAESQFGYSLDEMGAIVARVLRDMGLTSNFARLVIITGHGSSSLNNPHESAYNCGACAGGRGGPNARAFAQMANDPRVRHLLAQSGLAIPWSTVFVGAYHDTCNDRVTYFDLERLPSSHWGEFEYVKQCIDQARERNAHERCRRFETARLTLTPAQALRHVEARAVNLAEARPEFNHATNAATVVGRRERTRGLFLDRRVFLASYDPLQDDEQNTILARILQAVIPVCAGISLEYYFSCVDVENSGCSSKLPHNISSLLGVMAGASSDLRPGLSKQMIEIHEPMRQIFIIETTPQAMLQILDENKGIRQLCDNGWVSLATLSPHSSEIHVFQHGKFELYSPSATQLPVETSSADWYLGWRDHLGFASVGLNGNALSGMGHPLSEPPSVAGGRRR